MHGKLVKVLLVTSAAATLLAAPAIPASAQTAPTGNAAAAADSPRKTCRAELDKLHHKEGVCFWSGQDFTGTIDAHANPMGTDVCGNITPAKSMVNLTHEERLLYDFDNCDEGNFITEVTPYEARSEFGPGISAESWR
ncbi:hypothetical protein AB0F17_59895 [Nonomuraea sp. NPDC026600]|uniref:hypothetical protein n=1 Tax=Nonomuraea sp. NPDC026600 TaxID=3155363 RepID=UPI0033F6A932